MGMRAIQTEQPLPLRCGPQRTWPPPQPCALRLASASSCCSRCADSQLARCRASAACWQKRAADSRTRCRTRCSAASAARAAGSGGGGAAPCGLPATTPWLHLLSMSSSGSPRAVGGRVQQEHAIAFATKLGEGSGRLLGDLVVSSVCCSGLHGRRKWERCPSTPESALQEAQQQGAAPGSAAAACWSLLQAFASRCKAQAARRPSSPTRPLPCSPQLAAGCSHGGWQLLQVCSRAQWAGGGRQARRRPGARRSGTLTSCQSAAALR